MLHVNKSTQIWHLNYLPSTKRRFPFLQSGLIILPGYTQMFQHPCPRCQLDIEPCLPTEFLSFWPQPSPCPPKAILESGELQSFSWLPMMPILALVPGRWTLKPSLLQLRWREADFNKPFHALLPSLVFRYFPSAIRLYKELAFCGILSHLILSFPSFIPTQMSWKERRWYESNFISCLSSPPLIAPAW